MMKISQIIHLLYKTNSILKITDMSKLSEFGKTVFIENDLYKNNEIPVEIYGLNSEDFKEYLEKLGVDYDKNKDKAVFILDLLQPLQRRQNN